MKAELCCCESTILHELKIPEMKKKWIAQTYHLTIKSSENQLGKIDWVKINNAIKERWGMAGLLYIKKLAWSGRCFNHPKIKEG